MEPLKKPTQKLGASMPQINTQEIEKRLAALEAQAHEKCEGGGDAEKIAALEAKVDDLIARLQRKMKF